MRIDTRVIVHRLVVASAGVALAVPVASQTWIRSPINGHEYHVTAPMSWHSAHIEAQRLGGNLVTIRNQAEQDWLYATLGGSESLWIGFSDEGQEGRWRWISGEAVAYTNWAPGEPNNLNGVEHWAHITPRVGLPYGSDGRWNDNSNFWYRAIVERRLGHTTFPLDAVTAEGTAGYPGYFAVPRSRTQTLMMAEGFSSRAPGSVTALSWRRDRGTQQYAARRVDLAVRFGTPRVNPYGMSATFAHNHAGPLHEGFRGLVDVPAAPPELVGPAPFVVRVPLSAPWAWDGGDMLLEVEVFSNTLGNAGWEVDMQARQRGRGTVTLLGTGCSAGWGTPRLVPPDPRSLIPGGTIDTRLTNAPPGALAAAWFGNRTDEWNGVPMPFTFPGTGCTIYTNNMVGVILPVFGDGATPLLSVPLPPDPIIHGLTVYSQWGVFDLAGYPPIIPTDAFALTSAAAPSVWFDSIANLDGSATGVRSSEAHAAPVVQLEVR